MVEPIAAGESATWMPALFIASILLGRALAAGDDRAGVAHAPAGRRRRAGDEGDDRLRDLLRLMNSAASSSAVPPISPIMMIAFGLRDRPGTASSTSMKFVPSIGSPPMPTHVDWPSPTSVSLAHGFIRQRAGARDDADRARLVDVARHDADLALARRDDAGAVRADEHASSMPRQRALDARPCRSPECLR